MIRQRFTSADDITQHEIAIRFGRFKFSGRGYDYCVIEPSLTAIGTTIINDRK